MTTIARVARSASTISHGLVISAISNSYFSDSIHAVEAAYGTPGSRRRTVRLSPALPVRERCGAPA
jgi:hypothetical protein